MRPSFHCAIGWPPSAAYCRALSEVSWPITAGGAALRTVPAAPGKVVTTGIVASFWLTGAPSKASAGPASAVAPNTNATMARLDVRITLFLVRAARMGYCPTDRWSNLLSIFPERTRRMVSRASAPFGLALSQLIVAQLYVKGASDRVDLDDVAILQQSDRAPNGGLGPDMADAKAAGGAGEPAVGDERDLAAHALPGQSRGGLEHFPHAGTALRPLVADTDDFALAVGAVLDGLKGVLFPVEAASWTGEPQVGHSRDFHDRTFWRQIALQTDHTTGDGDRLVCRVHHILVRIPFHALEVFGDRATGDRNAVAVEKSVVEQRLHQKRYAANFKHVFGDITTTRLQIRDIRCLFEDFCHFEQVEFDAGLVRNRRQVQRSIGRAAGRGDHSCRILKRLARDDVARPEIRRDQVHYLLAGGHAEGVADFIRCRGTGRVRQRQPDRLGDGRHGVGGELRAAGAGRGARHTLDLVEVLVRHGADRVLADRLEHVLHGDLLSAEIAGQDRAAIDED